MTKGVVLRRAAFSILFFTSFFLPPSSRAHAAESMRVNPTKHRLVIPAGETRSGAIEIENTFNVPISVKAVLEDWKYASERNGTKEFAPPGTLPFSCANWITFAPTEFEIPPFGVARVNYTVRVPEGAQGARFAVLFFESLLAQPKAQAGAAAMGVMVRIGALFYIEPEGTVTRQAEISGISAKKESAEKPFVVSVDFKNTGTSDITCLGTFHVMDREGMVLARQDFERFFTFPGDTARVSAGWEKAFDPGEYDLVLTMDLGKAAEEAALGRGPVVTREAKIKIGRDGEVVSVGELR